MPGRSQSTRRRRAAPPPSPAARSIQELAGIYGVSTKHIDDLLATQGAPGKRPDGTYDLLEWGAFWRERGRFRRLGGQRAAGDDANWQERKDRAQALLAEQKIRDQLGMFARRDDVQRAAARDFTTLRLFMEGVPDRCAALVPPEEAAAVLDSVRTACGQILRVLRVALGRWGCADEEPGNPVADALDALHRQLEGLPAALGGVVKGEKTRARLTAAARVWVAEVRKQMADAAAAGGGDQGADA